MERNDFAELRDALKHAAAAADRLARSESAHAQDGPSAAAPAAKVCTPRSLPRDRWVAAAARARSINPLNHPPIERLVRVMPDFEPTPESIAVVTKKYWHTNGVRLSVSFLDSPPAALRARILEHMNAWAKSANVRFSETYSDGEVRIARQSGEQGGYWSYVGTDILQIQAGAPTMNLEEFSMDTRDSEFHRVVRHETGHTLGCPHEHMRRELVEKIDVKKAIDFFYKTQGWSEQETRQQVLTPIEEGSLYGTDHADPNSIMCYQIPGVITKDGLPIPGGVDIDALDYAFLSKVYPKS